MTRTITLTGRAAIEYADDHGLLLSKYADPIQGAMDGLTVGAAVAVIAEDPNLIYLTATLDDEYTYDRQTAAWLGNEIVTIPDQIYEDQRTHDTNNTVFPAILGSGVRVLVSLDGDAYGLHTSGTGDPVVLLAHATGE